MAKWQNDIVLDEGLSYIQDNVTEVYVCSSQPADRAAAITAALATKTGLTSGDFTGPADGDVSGRKITADAQSSLNVDVTGDATHIALCTGTTLVYVTTSTTQGLTSGNTVNIPAWDVEFLDVTP